MKVTLKRLLQRWTICVCKCTTFSWYWPLRLLAISRQKGFAISCSYEWYCAKHAQPSTIFFFFFLISHVVEKSFSFGSWKQTTLPKSLKSLDDLTATHEYQTITSWQRPKSSQGALLLLLAIVEPLGCKIIVILVVGCPETPGTTLTIINSQSLTGPMLRKVELVGVSKLGILPERAQLYQILKISWSYRI